MVGPAKDERHGHPGANSGRKGTLIRHTFLRAQTAPAKCPLMVSVIESPLRTLLVTAVGQAPVLAIALVATGRTAVTVPVVTVATDPKQLLAREANPLMKNNFAMGRCHLASPAGLDNGYRSWQGRNR
jgi:hypothetical protein